MVPGQPGRVRRRCRRLLALTICVRKRIATTSFRTRLRQRDAARYLGRMTSLAVFLLALGSALRLTRLAVADTITQPFRSWLGLRYAATMSAHAAERAVAVVPAPDDIQKIYIDRMAKLQRRAGVWLWLIQLFECPWCIGFWISMGVAGAALGLSPGDIHSSLSTWLAIWPALGLSISYLVGVVYTAVYTLEGWEPGGTDRH